LQEEIRELEIKVESEYAHSEQEIGMRQQHIENLERSLAEAKTTLENFQKNSTTTFDQTIKGFNDERESLTTKVENLKMDLIQKEKEIYNLQSS